MIEASFFQGKRKPQKLPQNPNLESIRVLNLDLNLWHVLQNLLHLDLWDLKTSGPLPHGDTKILGKLS